MYRTQRSSLAAIALAVPLVGCSALVDTDIKQCTKDEDCANKSGADQGATCDVMHHVCVKDAIDPNAKVCTTQADCGTGQFCTRGGSRRTCAALKTEQCPFVYPEDALKDDNVLLLGMIAALSGNDPYGGPQRLGAEAALADITRIGFPRPDAPNQTRPIAMVICDEDDVTKAAEHLAENLKVPAIVGASTSSKSKRAVEVTTNHKVLLLSPSATSPELRDFGKTDQGDLFWRTVPADDQQVAALRRVFPLVEKAARSAARAAQPPVELNAVKVTLLFKDDLAGDSLRKGLQAMPLSSEVDAIRYSVPAATEEGKAKYEAEWEMHVNEVLALQPHVVMPLGTTEFVDKALEKIETRWPLGVQRPWYVMPEGSKTNAINAIAAKLPLVKLEQRVIGTAPGARRGEGWTRFLSALTTQRVEPGNLAEFAFDSVYLLAYATAISRQLFPTGVQLRDALAKTSCKGPTPTPVRIFTGSMGFRAAFDSARQENSCVDFEGASGPVDFDADGETKNDYSLWCSTGGSNPTIVSLQTYYDLEEDKLLDGTVPSTLDLSVPGWCKPR